MLTECSQHTLLNISCIGNENPNNSANKLFLPITKKKKKKRNDEVEETQPFQLGYISSKKHLGIY